MKIIGILVIALFLSCNFTVAQDTLYIYRSGLVIAKQAVAEIDSVTFNKNYSLPDLNTFTDQTGNVYHAIKIGNQTWMMENLKTYKYRNGDNIQNITLALDWRNATTGAWCVYNNDIVNETKYGKLYNWYAVSDSRMIAPVGWHVATDSEWTILSTFLGGSDIAGGKLKESGIINWASPNVGATNETKFTALPGGECESYEGIFSDIGIGSYWWSSTMLNETYAIFRSMGYNQSGVGSSGSPKKTGLYVRCVKDVLPVITTTVPGSIQTTSAKAGGNISEDGGTPVISRGICWGNSPNPTIANSKTTDGTGIGIFSSLITGLIADSTYYVRAYATNNVGTSYGDQVSFKTLEPELQTVTDLVGNVYHAVKIGNQTWMVENLKTFKYRNGDSIQNLKLASDWRDATTGAWCVYNNDTVNETKYGKLYNWYAVSDSRMIAPVGWHVATDAEWTILSTFLGGSDIAGGKLKESGNINWASPNVGATNETNFTALPGGECESYEGVFSDIGFGSYWWSSTMLDYTYSWFRSMGNNNSGIGRSGSPKKTGLYVRCVKDVLPVITTLLPGSIQTTTAITGGNISEDGGTPVTSRGICWGILPNPTITNGKTTDGTGIGTFSSLITGLMADSTYYVRAYATNNVGTTYGNQVCFKTLHSQLQTVTDIDGNVYKTVTIGTQTWMAENLKVVHYRDGSTIPNVTSNSIWGGITTGAWCDYSNLSINEAIYGHFYNGYAAVDSRNIAPNGWHVPSDAEWTKLTNYLGGNAIAGAKLKETGLNHWLSPNVGATNESGFNGVANGSRRFSGEFDDLGKYAIFYTSTVASGSNLYYRALYYNDSLMNIKVYSENYGFAIRCIKD